MKKYFIYLFFLSLIFSLKIFAQEDSLLVKSIIISDFPIKIDTNFINQNEFNVYKNNKVIIDSLYQINFSNGMIHFHEKLNSDTVIVKYKLLYPDITFSKLDTSIYIPFIENEQVFLDTYNYKKNKNQNLQTNGTIERSFSSGNSQNFSINTEVDLRISGKVSENLFLDCNISDSSIPIDYGQSTTSLQELDKVYIKLYNKKTFLKGGDIIINNLENPFLKFSRNSIGLTYNHVDTNLTNTASIGITKNMFRRQVINPINGNQGPYKLSGNNDEIYVLIIPNSENIFIDGVKKEKGPTKDYTINYNTGEIIFTPNTLINENQRIIIEFQYSGQNYFRWLSHAGSNFKKGDFRFKVNFFTEQDSKGNPITAFSNDQINQMIEGGDDEIFSNTFNLVEFSQNSSQILYTIKDSVDLNFIQHDSIYVFSNNPIDTLYNVNFEYVGENQGNYILDKNLINGNIFIWVAPLNGVSQGDYEPKKLLITPQKKQMFTAGFDYVKKEQIISFNIGLSNHDKNTFSNLGDENNIAWAMNFLAKKNFHFKKFNLQSKINYDFVEKEFMYIDRTRDLEFLRNWNVEDSILSQSNQHKINIQIISDFFKLGKTSYDLEIMNINNYYKLRHVFNTELKKKSFSTNIFTSILKDHAINKDILFLQYDFLLQKKGQLKFGINNIGEQKKDYLDPLNKNSFNKLVLFSAILKNDRSFLDINYTNRIDVKPQNIGSLNENTVEIKTFLIKNKNSKLNIQSSYSSYNSNIQDSIKKEENIMGRLNYSIKINGFLNINGFYEISNGKEFLRDFRFIKVNPGYGSFSWIDYNNNGLEEFDEFENSNFSDTADYIRISFPTNEFFNVRNLKYQQQISFHPNFNKNKLSSFFSRTRNSFNVQIDKKFLDDDFTTIINPFSINFSSQNTLSLNFNILNHFTYKSHNNKYFFAYKTKKSLLKNTLNYGEESTSIISHNIQGQRNLGLMTLNIFYEYSSCTTNNQNMINRNYMIDKNEIRSEFSFDFNKITPSLMFTSVHKNNNNDETLIGQKLHLSVDLLGPKKLSLNSSIIAFNMNYTGNTFSSLGHDMLDGLSEGKGLDIQFSILKSINQTNFSIQYTGRLNEQRVFHSARFELKRYF